MKCPNCSCELELKAKDGGTMIEKEGDNLVKKQHAQIGAKIDEDYAKSQQGVTK